MAANRQQEVAAATADLDLTQTGYQIVLETTAGPIRLSLDAAKAPNHCLNMLGLAKIGFYDGVPFHRVISGFMIQGGCPQGSGFGGPGYTIDNEFNDTQHVPGTLSMARSSDPNSAGSQFFICLERVPHLDGEYTAFGQTADAASLEVVKKIGAMPVDGNDRPKTEVKIIKAVVEAA